MDQNQPELRNYSGHLRKLSELPALQGGRQSFEERYRNLRVFVRFAGPKGQNVNSPGCDPGLLTENIPTLKGSNFPPFFHSASLWIFMERQPVFPWPVAATPSRAREVQFAKVG